MPMRTVDELMTQSPVCCTPDDGVIECAKLMADENVGMLPVVESRDTRRLIGVVTDRDLCLEVVGGGLHPADVIVEDCMSDELHTVRPEDSLERALELMKHEQVRRLPVIDDSGACVGVIAQADVALYVQPRDVKETIAEISRPTQK